MVHCPRASAHVPRIRRRAHLARIRRGVSRCPAILLVKDDHAVRRRPPSTDVGPVDVRRLWVQFHSGHASRARRTRRRRCASSADRARRGTSSSPRAHPVRIAADGADAREGRWVAPCLKSRGVHGAPRRRDAHQGARARRPHLHAALVPHEHRRTERMDPRRHARARVALRRRRQRIYRLPFRRPQRVLARPAGVAVVETVAQAQGENIEIDCISRAPRGAVTVRAALAQSSAQASASGVSFLSLTKRDDFRPRRRSEGGGALLSSTIASEKYFP